MHRARVLAGKRLENGLYATIFNSRWRHRLATSGAQWRWGHTIVGHGLSLRTPDSTIDTRHKRAQMLVLEDEPKACLELALN